MGWPDGGISLSVRLRHNRHHGAGDRSFPFVRVDSARVAVRLHERPVELAQDGGWTLLVGVILIGGVAAAIAIAQYWEEWFPPQLGLQTQYAGLKLGMSPQEVMYVKGNPPEVFGEESTDPEWKAWFNVIETDRLEKGKKVTDYTAWSYEEYKHSINVLFNESARQ
jgi:hypothetical protein